MKKLQRIQWVRNIVQFISLLIFPALFSQAFSACKEALAAIGSGEPLAWTAFSMMTAGNFHIGAYAVGLVLLLLIVVGMAWQERFFCQFLCPMGAVFSLLPELPATSLKRNCENCIPNCQACRRQCPVRIKTGESSLRAGECIRCGKCVSICPKNNIFIMKGKKKQEKS